ncbi:hypothetical protein [uncultured Microbacterium sp.]|uniref:hypothetical protein n=1 Tax=uncultured Microbacterium sp. TaxID=191216 RepID=UPI0025DBE076|nr:hypothetical protein [uncultured Microbacterium sp.]
MLVTDTLVVQGANDTPVYYSHKVHPLPQLKIVMASTGTAEVAEALLEYISTQAGLRDIDDVDKIATEKLREFQENVAEEHGDAETTTIYLYGFPFGTRNAVA